MAQKPDFWGFLDLPIFENCHVVLGVPPLSKSAKKWPKIAIFGGTEGGDSLDPKNAKKRVFLMFFDVFMSTTKMTFFATVEEYNITL